MAISITSPHDIAKRIAKLEARVKQCDRLVAEGRGSFIVHGKPAVDRARLDRFTLKRWYAARTALLPS